MIRVLVVDDDFMVAKVHAGFVARMAAFEVVGVAPNRGDARAACASWLPTWCCSTSTCPT